MRELGRVTLLLLLTGLGGMAAEADGQPAAAGGPAPLTAWIYATDPEGLAARDAALAIADHLLDTAGLRVDWRHCDRPGDCEALGKGARGVTLILSAARRRPCGMAALEPGPPSATIFISVPCVAEVVLALERKPSTRWHPSLSRVALPTLLGAAIAHELGHVLGLKHAATGLMRARLEAEEIAALQGGTLAFTRTDAAQMRASAFWPERVDTRAR